MPGFIEIGEVLGDVDGGMTGSQQGVLETFTEPTYLESHCQWRAKTRSNSRHHAHAACGPCPRFHCDLYGYCRIIGVTEQLYSLVDDLTTGHGRRGEQYLLYHLHCERHYDRQMTKYNDFVKMSPISKFTKPLQYGHCPSQCLSYHRFKAALILDKAVYICEPHAPAKANSTHQQHSVLCVSFGSHIGSTCKHNELIDRNK